jgi:hypothetical protein
MRKLFVRTVLVAIALLAWADASWAVVIFGPNSTHARNVFCGSNRLGRMEIGTYRAFKAANDPVLDNTGGVEIRGQFTAEVAHRYHYLQVVTLDDQPLAWISDGLPVSVPYIDPPPGGYVGSPFDFLPWYDPAGLPFPGFFDRPRNPLTDSKRINPFDVQFETWLVCVVGRSLGPFDRLAQDDFYRVAPLLGWEWGFSTAYRDVDPLGIDDLGDFTVTKTPFAFRAAPSALWLAGLDQVYGRFPNQDFWIIQVVDCTRCVPVPGGLVIWSVLSVVAIGYTRIFVRKKR